MAKENGLEELLELAKMGRTGLTPAQRAKYHRNQKIRAVWGSLPPGAWTADEVAEMFKVSKWTVLRAVEELEKKPKPVKLPAPEAYNV